MGHSIEDYLKRRTDDELDYILRMYEQQTEDAYYDSLVKMILRIMQERKEKST